MRRTHTISLSLLLGLISVSLLLLLARPPVSRAATLTVTSAADSGPGTLRQAILDAVSGDTIEFSLPAHSTITLTSGELLINKNLTIIGPGANQLAVQRSTASGTPAFRIFNIPFSSITVSISGLKIANGNALVGGAIANRSDLTITNITISGNSSSAGGGGFFNDGGFVTIAKSTISGNSSTGGSGIRNDGGTVNITNSTISGNTTVGLGGGIFNASNATLRIVSSTLSDNSANTGGGGISNNGPLTITNSTISGNTSAAGSGGGISNDGPLTITNSTISGNSANSSGGGIRFFNTFLPSLRNTILARNGAPIGPDASPGLTSEGFNLIGNNSGATITPVTGDQIGTAASPLDPLLGPLQNNGGATQTHALLSGSTAIERGHSSGSSTDQRGFARPVDDPVFANASGGDGSDIGAYEVQADLLPGCNSITREVNNNGDSGAGSLRAVIANVCAGTTITFAANVTGAITLTSGELLINKTLTINGPGANQLTVKRSASAGNFRIFNIGSAGNASISGLTIANGNPLGNLIEDVSGGGIFNNGSLTLSNSAISANTASFGSGIYNNTNGTVTIVNGTISGNTARFSGGGVYNSGPTGTVTVITSTISGNSASESGVGNGAGIFNGGGTVTITNSTIAGNTAQDRGGGIFNNGTLRSRNTIIAVNTAPLSGGGPDVFGALTSQGFNLIGSNKDTTISPAQFSDQIGTPASPIDPLLGPLQDNGGPTQTRALFTGSTGINKGHSSGSNTDQRGFIRPVGFVNVSGGDGSDIGAVETENTVHFSASSYQVNEAGFRVTVTIVRTGDTSGAASIRFSTNDAAGLQNCNIFNGVASPRCDYINTIGFVQFAAGETSKSFSVAVVNDSYAEGNENFSVTLNNPTGASLGTQSSATVIIVDDENATGPNPIDQTEFFVRQQYLDFLGREPDPPGFVAWVNTINNCPSGDTSCDRIHVSSIFFQSAEFRQRGLFVYLVYPVSFGRKPDYEEFVVDLARVSGFLSDAQLEAAKVQFITDFMARTAFVAKYNSLDNMQFVDTLLATAGVSLSSRQAMIDGLNGATLTRAQVLRQISESPEVTQKYFNQAFAVMEYFGYLRRQPDAFYLDWIQVLDSGASPRAMVTGFVTSLEYRQRFGP